MATTTYTAELIATARAIAAPGKGILAADESVPTIGKRFTPIGVENTEENRRKYRELLFTTKGLGEFISGAICFEETLGHATADGTSFVDLMKAEGIIPGIKVDKGVKPLYGTDGETVTQGLDDLDRRCAHYYSLGARFAKFRSVLKISASGCPSELSIAENTGRLARYAAICQANGLVPIVEPECLMDGPHSIETAAEVTQRILVAQYKALCLHNVLLEGTLLKPNMVRPGTDNTAPCTAADIGRATFNVLLHSVPGAVPSINFLSGGMSELQATGALNEVNASQKASGKVLWSLSFSYGRALQKSVLEAWKGDDANIPAAQAALMHRARMNGLAAKGEYKPEMEGAAAEGAAGSSLHVSNYSY